MWNALVLALLALISAEPRNHQHVEWSWTPKALEVVPPPLYSPGEDIRNELDADLLLEEAEGGTHGPSALHTNSTRRRIDPRTKKKYPNHPCAKDSATVWSLVRLLDSADFQCADEVMSRLAPQVEQRELNLLMARTNGAKRMRTRWNALYGLGKLCWAGPEVCAKLAPLSMSNPAKIKAMHTLCHRNMPEFRETLQLSILNEHTAGILKSALNLARTGNWLSSMPRQRSVRKKLLTIAGDSRIDATTRFLAVQAWSDIAVQNWLAGDTAFLQQCINHWDQYVRRDCAFTVKKVYSKLPRHEQKVVKSELIEALGGENDLITRSNLASAFDHTVSVDTGIRKSEGSLIRRLRLVVQERDIAHVYSTSNIKIRSSLSDHSAVCWGQMVAWEREAYHILFPGGRLSGKAMPTDIEVFVFPTPNKYDQYMQAFVGSGVGAGGFFYEAKDRLYTYQRTGDRYYISVEELVMHELTHYFNKYDLFRNPFGSKASQKEADTWLNEGLAEYMGGLNFDDHGCFTTPMRGNYMRRLCRGDIKKWNLQALLDSNDHGFDYQQGYTFVYYLASKQQRALRRIMHAFRSGSYRTSDWQKTTGYSVGQMEGLWKAAVTSWCEGTDWQHLPSSYFDKQSPVCIPGAPRATRARGCGIIGHGTRRMAQGMKLDLNFSYSGPGGVDEL